MNFDDQDVSAILDECCAGFEYDGPSVWHETSTASLAEDGEDEEDEGREWEAWNEEDVPELNFDLD